MRRFPPPWTIDEANDACFIVRDSTRQALGYFYFEDEPGRRSAAKLLTRRGPLHGGELRQAAGVGAPKRLRPQVRLAAAIWNHYRSGFGFHSRARFCASAICVGVILAATKSRCPAALLSPPAAAKLNHMCALT